MKWDYRADGKAFSAKRWKWDMKQKIRSILGLKPKTYHHGFGIGSNGTLLILQWERKRNGQAELVFQAELSEASLADYLAKGNTILEMWRTRKNFKDETTPRS